MPRSARLHVPGGFYHVVLRGNHREALFGTADDRQIPNDIVADSISRHSARAHAFPTQSTEWAKQRSLSGGRVATPSAP